MGMPVHVQHDQCVGAEEAGSEASDVDEDDVIHATAASRQGEGEKQTAAEESESESEEEEAGE